MGLGGRGPARPLLGVPEADASLLPSRLHGLRLKRARSRPCASALRNCGMPSLALQGRVGVGVRVRAGPEGRAESVRFPGPRFPGPP